MKFHLIIDETREEEVLVYCHKRTPLTDAIECLINEESLEITGFRDNEIKRLELNEIYCFLSENNKVFAVCENDKFLLKTRLYKLEERLGKDFVKINQSCIANIQKIEHFDTSVSGTLKVVFKNKYVDFVSRRQLKNIKERLGL